MNLTVSPPPLSRFKAFIFDIDGTLLDSVDAHAESWVATLAHFGIGASFADVRGRIGEGADRLLDAILPSDKTELRKEVEAFRSRLFAESFLPKVAPFPRVRDLFLALRRQGAKAVLGSSCTADEISKYKQIAGISDLTDGETTSDDARASKPAPDIFQRALRQLSSISLSECVVVGDTRFDGEAARAAGIAFIGVLCGGSDKKELERSGAVATFQDPAALLAVLNRQTDSRVGQITFDPDRYQTEKLTR